MRALRVYVGVQGLGLGHFQVGSVFRALRVYVGVQGLGLGHFQVGSYRYRSLIEALYTLY